MRFHLDEHVDPAIAVALRQRGIDVTTTRECGLEAAFDRAQLEFATTNRAVFVTNDSDFLQLHSLGIEHSGIAFYPHQNTSVGYLVGSLLLLSAVFSDDEMRSRVEFL